MCSSFLSHSLVSPTFTLSFSSVGFSKSRCPVSMTYTAEPYDLMHKGVSSSFSFFLMGALRLAIMHSSEFGNHCSYVIRKVAEVN